jgi:symplekin
MELPPCTNSVSACLFWFQGLFSTRGIDDALKSSWEWLLKFKSAVSLMAFQASPSPFFCNQITNLLGLHLSHVESLCQTTGNEGARLLAVKFVEKTVLMYTPDPNIPSDPPSEATKGTAYAVFHMELDIFHV